MTDERFTLVGPRETATKVYSSPAIVIVTLFAIG